MIAAENRRPGFEGIRIAGMTNSAGMTAPNTAAALALVTIDEAVTKASLQARLK